VGTVSPNDAGDPEDEVVGERYLTRNGKIRMVVLTKSSRLVSWTAEYVKTGQALEPIVQKAFLKTFLHLISMGMIVKEMKTLSREQIDEV
jgi:hypothetical protein